MEYIIQYWRYEGYYKEGFYDGKGLYKYTDVDIYNGNCKNDLRERQGTYMYTHGNKHEGQWKEGKKHGEGTYINKNLCKLSKESEEKKDLLTNVRLAKPTPGFCIRSEKYSIKYPA